MNVVKSLRRSLRRSKKSSKRNDDLGSGHDEPISLHGEEEEEDEDEGGEEEEEETGEVDPPEDESDEPGVIKRERRKDEMEMRSLVAVEDNGHHASRSQDEESVESISSQHSTPVPAPRKTKSRESLVAGDLDQEEEEEEELGLEFNEIDQKDSLEIKEDSIPMSNQEALDHHEDPIIFISPSGQWTLEDDSDEKESGKQTDPKTDPTHEKRDEEAMMKSNDNVSQESVEDLPQTQDFTEESKPDNINASQESLDSRDEEDNETVVESEYMAKDQEELANDEFEKDQLKIQMDPRHSPDTVFSGDSGVADESMFSPGNSTSEDPYHGYSRRNHEDQCVRSSDIDHNTWVRNITRYWEGLAKTSDVPRPDINIIRKYWKSMPDLESKKNAASTAGVQAKSTKGDETKGPTTRPIVHWDDNTDDRDVCTLIPIKERMKTFEKLASKANLERKKHWHSMPSLDESKLNRDNYSRYLSSYGKNVPIQSRHHFNPIQSYVTAGPSVSGSKNVSTLPRLSNSKDSKETKPVKMESEEGKTVTNKREESSKTPAKMMKEEPLQRNLEDEGMPKSLSNSKQPLLPQVFPSFSWRDESNGEIYNDKPVPGPDHQGQALYVIENGKEFPLTPISKRKLAFASTNFSTSCKDNENAKLLPRDIANAEPIVLSQSQLSRHNQQCGTIMSDSSCQTSASSSEVDTEENFEQLLKEDNFGSMREPIKSSKVRYIEEEHDVLNNINIVRSVKEKFFGSK